MFDAILTADLCLAVLTGHNPNVFYELAIAQSIGRPVIILIERGQTLPFDIKDLRCVLYDLDIRSFLSRTHINRVASMVEEIDRAGWVANDLPIRLDSVSGAGTVGLTFFETSGDYGTESTWRGLLDETQDSFDVMGISLTSWRRTRNFRQLLTQKAAAGCRIRLMLMHPDNPILQGLPLQAAEKTLEGALTEIAETSESFQSIAAVSPRIEIRQIFRGIPHFFLTRTDLRAVLILYLSSQTWGAGPLWECTRDSKLYEVARQEFDTLWNLNDPSFLALPSRQAHLTP